MTNTDYTPALGAVRLAWVIFNAGASVTPEEARAEFDRWLAAHDEALEAKVRADERERENR